MSEPTATVHYNDGTNTGVFHPVIDVATKGGFLTIVTDDGATIIPAHRIHLAAVVAIEAQQ